MPAIGDIVQRSIVVASLGACGYAGLLIASGLTIRRQKARDMLEMETKLAEDRLHPDIMAAGSLAKPEVMPS